MQKSLYYYVVRAIHSSSSIVLGRIKPSWCKEWNSLIENFKTGNSAFEYGTS